MIGGKKDKYMYYVQTVVEFFQHTGIHNLPSIAPFTWPRYATLKLH